MFVFFSHFLLRLPWFVADKPPELEPMHFGSAPVDKVWEAIPPRLPKNRGLDWIELMMGGLLGGWVISTTTQPWVTVFFCSGYILLYIYIYSIYTHHRVKWTIRPSFGDSDWTLKFCFFFNLVFSRERVEEYFQSNNPSNCATSSQLYVHWYHELPPPARTPGIEA